MPHVRREQSNKSSSHAICSGPLECKSHLPPSGLTSAAGLGELKSPLRALASTSAFCGAIHDGLQARQQKQRRRSSYSRLYSFLSGPVGARPKLREKVFYKRERIFEDSARARLRVASSTSLRATRGQQHISADHEWPAAHPVLATRQRRVASEQSSEATRFWGFIFRGLMCSWVLEDSPRFPGVWEFHLNEAIGTFVEQETLSVLCVDVSKPKVCQDT